jgi:hypothetical protein
MQHIQHIQAILINYNICTITQHVNEHRSGTYLLLEDHQLRADLPRTSKPYTTLLITLSSGHPQAETKLHPRQGNPRLG